MRSRLLSLAVTLLVGGVSATAQTIGNYIVAPNASVSGLQPPYTVIDLSSPATTGGTIGAVAIRGAQTCAGAFKIKFFHVNAGVYTPYAERGPYDVNFAINVVQLSPAVTVTAGDVIGIVALNDCSRVVGQLPLLYRNAAQFSGDVSSAVTLASSSGVLTSFGLGVFGAANSNVQIRTHIIPAAGAAQGQGGSNFKTDLFITNARTTRAAGTLVYHREGTSGSPNDTPFPFIVDPHTSVTYPNFVAEKIGVTGKGSIDVYTRMGYEAPTVTARIYDDNPASGTKGFTLDAMTDREALQPLESATIAVPSDPAKYRMNIGLRTLEGATPIEFVLFNQNGGVRASFVIPYGSNYYEQTDFRSHFGVDFQPGDSIQVTVQQGQAFVYGSIVDNTSNDPSVQLAKAVK